MIAEFTRLNLQGSINRKLDSINRTSYRFFFCRISNSTQAHMTCRVLCFALSIKGKTLATFLGCCLCCVCESLVRSRGVCLHTYLGFPISRLMLRAWWSFQLLHKGFKENTSRSTCGCCESKKEVVHGLVTIMGSW